LFATILTNEYPDLIGIDDTNRMKSLLSQVKNNDDPLQKIQATQKLKELTDEYPILITLFTVKMSSDNAAKQNPSDGLKLLQMHDQIVNHFRNRRKDQAFALLDEAIELRDKYSSGGLDLGGSIHLGK
jgi:molecular chaperone DnaK